MLAYSLRRGVQSMLWLYPEQLWRRLVDLLVNTLNFVSAGADSSFGCAITLFSYKRKFAPLSLLGTSLNTAGENTEMHLHPIQ